MPEVKLPPKAKDLLNKLQAYQQQLQNIITQKRYLEVQRGEIKNALKELGKIKGKVKVYKSVGPILIKSKKSKTQKDLKDRQETIKLRIDSFEKQEKKVRQVIQNLQKKLRSYLE